MSRQRCEWLLLASIAWLAAGNSLSGQVPPPDSISAEKRERSHVPLPQGGANRAAFEKLLKERLGRAQDADKAQQFLQEMKRYLSEDQLKALKEMVQDDPQRLESLDPALKDVIRQWTEGQKSLPPEQLEKLQRLLDKQLRVPIPTSIDPPPGVPQPPRPPETPRESTAPAPADQERDVKFRQRMLDLAEKLFDKSGRGSSALRRAESDLRERRFPQAEEWLQLRQRTQGLRSRMPELRQSLHLDELVRESGWIFRRRPSLPDVGDWRPGQTGMGGGPSPGSLGSFDSSGDTPGWQTLVWLVLGAALVVAFWKVLAAQRKPAAESVVGPRLGPWPVHPSAVKTRDELVRAFEHLTVLCLGPAARCWNHLQIADRLGETAPGQRREAARQLAGLYEQARYAPPDEPLPDGVLAAARRHLCVLAGVSAV